MGWVDLTLLALLAVSVLVGIWRGVVFELLALVGWVVAYLAAGAYGQQVAQHLPIGARGSAVNLAAAMALTFVVVLIVWSLLARLARMVVQATPLSAVDRVLGASFGLVRGLLVGLAIALLVAATPWQKSPAWQQSRGAAWLGTALRDLGPWLPASLADHLPR